MHEIVDKDVRIDGFSPLLSFSKKFTNHGYILNYQIIGMVENDFFDVSLRRPSFYFLSERLDLLESS